MTDLEDLDNLDLTSCKDRIIQLQADRERRLEATERLQEKLKALNNELAARRLEAEQRRAELKEEQNRNKKRAEMQREAGEVALQDDQKAEEDRQKVRNFTEEMMQEKASGPNKKEKKLSNYGFRIFDETELMVEKPIPQGVPESLVDTVLVTHQKPNSDDVRYHLSYRVASTTPSKKLREDACNYWNLSEVEYILLTVEHSKVHDDVILQHCFKNHECCQLILAPKDPRRTILSDKELEATSARVGGKKRSKKAEAKNPAEDASKRMGQKESFIDWMQAKPGIWDFMMQRDCNVIDHLTRIKLRSICIYFIFLVLCMATLYFVKPSNKGYYMRQGSVTAMTSAMVDPDTGDMVLAYDDIKTHEDAWKWLTYVVSGQLMTASSGLRTHSYLAGWVRVRMQQVKEASTATCQPQEEAPSNLQCVDPIYSATTAGAEELDFLRMYWQGYNATTTVTYTTTTQAPAAAGGRRLDADTTAEGSASGRRLFLQPKDTSSHFFNADDEAEAEAGRFLDESTDSSEVLGEEARRLSVYGMANWTQNYPYTADEPTVAGKDGRGTAAEPWQWKAAAANSATHAVSALTGHWQNYDSSGYNLDYNLQYNNLTALYSAYRADMLALRERGWFTKRTRAIIVSFVLYSSSYDLWSQNDFILEMPVSTIVVPDKHINLFRPSVKGSADASIVFYMDIVRLVLAVFIITLQVYNEVGYCKKREESWLFGYILTPLGLADIGIFVLMAWIFVVRQVMLGMVEDPQVFLDSLIKGDATFQSNSAKAAAYHQQIVCEGPLFCLLLFRLLSFLRINRNIYIMWTTLVEATKIYLPFCLGLIPVALGLVVWSHAMWHSTLRNYGNLPVAAMSVTMIAHGDIQVNEMFHTSRPDAMVLGMVLFVMIWLILINGWIAVLCHVYQNVRVRAGYRPSDYAWKEKHYVDWMLWRPFAKCYFKWLRPGIERPKWFQDTDDDDD